MPGRVRIAQRVPKNVRVTIERLRIGRTRHNRVRTEEPPQLRRIEPCPIVIDPQPRQLALTREQLIRVHCSGREARLAVGIEPILPHDRPAGVRHDAGRTQVVFEDEIQRAVDPHRAADRVIHGSLRHRAAGGLIHFVHAGIEGLAAIRLDFLCQVAVAVVEELPSLPINCYGGLSVIKIAG